ncbi:MAG: TonB-dependent receptor [Bacteroidetes bacterium]|nr:TonB-dependent receptor [Bacteroidota bacterium]
MKYKLFILLLFANVSLFAQSFTISGYISDKKTGETLIGATVSNKANKQIGVSANTYGFYSLKLPKGNYELLFSYIGYQEQTIKVNLTESKKLNVTMNENNVQLGEIVISANRENNRITQTQMGIEKLNVITISKLPVLFGEKDILKTMQLLPGVKAAGEGQSGFTVRGGSIDQNLILLDDAPVYNASHLLGFFSTFNSDAIKDVTLYKGTAPAQFGGRISSVVDLKMNDGNNQGFGANGSIGLISSKLNIEGPIQKGKSSFLISGRRTYADLFLKLSDQFKDNQLYFYDLNTKFNYRFSDKDQLFVSGYFGRDVLGLNNRFAIDWGNSTATIRYNHLFNDRLFLNTSLIYSNYDYNINLTNNANPFSILSRVRDWNIKQELQYFSNNKNEWRFGYNVIYHSVIPGKITDAVSTENLYDLRNGLESALYASNERQINEKIKISFGLRLSDFAVLGGSNYYVLDNNHNITDTINQSNPVKNYINLEPRFSVNYIFDNSNSLKAAYSRNTQNLHLINNSVTTSPTDKWVMNTNIIKPEIGDQISLGYFRNFKDNTYEMSIETYYKWMQNQIDYRDAADERNRVIETQLLYGKGRAYGIEFLLKKNKGKLTGWIGYTLSRTEKEIEGINNNDWYPSRQDRTHDISIVLMYDISKRLNVSAVWVYQTGNAVTFPSGKYEVAGQTIWLYTERNAYRMPDYHRLDLGLTYKFKEKKHFNSELAFGLYNAYGRENAYLISFDQSESDPNKTVAKQTSLFRWVPSISWNFKF